MRSRPVHRPTRACAGAASRAGAAAPTQPGEERTTGCRWHLRQLALRVQLGADNAALRHQLRVDRAAPILPPAVHEVPLTPACGPTPGSVAHRALSRRERKNVATAQNRWRRVSALARLAHENTSMRQRLGLPAEPSEQQLTGRNVQRQLAARRAAESRRARAAGAPALPAGPRPPELEADLRPPPPPPLVLRPAQGAEGAAPRLFWPRCALFGASPGPAAQLSDAPAAAPWAPAAATSPWPPAGEPRLALSAAPAFAAPRPLPSPFAAAAAAAGAAGVQGAPPPAPALLCPWRAALERLLSLPSVASLPLSAEQSEADASA